MNASIRMEFQLIILLMIADTHLQCFAIIME